MGIKQASDQQGEDKMEQKKAIIMGASSGMGKELAKILSGNDYIVGLAARRIDLLN
jgi:short-subunit dehydrogenase